ncbi:flavin reductase [Clostridium hydrogenum]|uniref:flavin reductase n=1 Tax=Clostridium hydrogenum TaxID=2855764 RepID=UPI001F31BF39|nr:flavin reductase [Clostridium hydrogenum]
MFKEIKIEELQFNPFTKIAKEWMLITAGNKENFNTMTASWGGLGVLWNVNTATVYIRPQRYTKEFIDANDTFTIAFFDEKYRKALNVCGSVSGRDTDKIKQAGLTPYFAHDTVAFEEASLIMVCKKLYHNTLLPEHFDGKDIDEKMYPNKDYHTMYISEIVKVLENTK